MSDLTLQAPRQTGPRTKAVITPALLVWARERARQPLARLIERFPALPDWESGLCSPTVKQAAAFARAVHVTPDLLALPQPPEEPLPIPDCRSSVSENHRRPSANLLDMIAACRERQEWYGAFAADQPELAFVGCLSTDLAPEQAAATLQKHLEFEPETRRRFPSWTDALRHLFARADALGILAMVSGIVLSNPHRPLLTDEFAGFTLADRVAPLIFVNGSEIKAVQMFTLVRELVHLWLGASALSDTGVLPAPVRHEQEIWCHAVTAEFLMPRAALQAEILPDEKLNLTVSRLARHFKVSPLVVLRRLLDIEAIDLPTFTETWIKERHRLIEAAAKRGRGGNFYTQTVSRIGMRFTRALVESTLLGETRQRDALRMMGISKAGTLTELGRSIGLMT